MALPDSHVAVLAFPFGSHAPAIFNLMLKLASAAPHLQFSFLSTKKSNDSLLSASSLHLPNNIKAYNVDDGVPTAKLISAGNPSEAVELFLKATPDNFIKGLDAAVAETDRKITCLVTDGFLTFAGEMAENMHARWFPVFVTMPYDESSHVYSRIIRERLGDSRLRQLDEDKTLEFIPGLSIMRVFDLSDDIFLDDSGSAKSALSLMLSKLGDVLPQATAVVMNFYQELYATPDLINDLKSKFSSLLNVGFFTQPLPALPLPPSDSDETGCLRWLARQKEDKSVAYIGFGTVAIPPQDELIALAEALEESKIPFLWSLRDDKLKQLPENFLQRISSGRGKIVPWAPQFQVLGHRSIGVFVTHCGTNSVSESIANGVPIICRPMFADNFMNARMIEEIWGIGVKVEGTVFTKSGVLKSLDLVFSQEKGKKIRENVQALKQIVINAAGPNGSANRDFNTLIEKISS